MVNIRAWRIVYSASMQQKPFVLSAADRDLIADRFKIENPETLPGLMARLPENAELEAILYRYDETPPGGEKFSDRPRILRAHCHGARHWKGYVIQLKGGATALIGVDCGEKQFGLSFKTIDDDFRAREDRQDYLVRFARVHELLPEFREQLVAINKSNALGRFDSFTADFSKKFSFVVGSFKRSGGRLIVSERIRDSNAEDAKARSQVPDLVRAVEDAGRKSEGVRKAAVKRLKRWIDDNPVNVIRETEAGIVLGFEIFNAKESPEQLIRQALRTVLDICKEIEGKPSDQLRTADFSTAFKRLQSAFERFDKALALMRAFNRFTANIHDIAKWSSAEIAANPRSPVGGVIRIDEGDVVVERADGEVRCPLDRIDLPTVRPMVELRRAVGAPSPA